jgi:thioesterase domain-containing protein
VLAGHSFAGVIAFEAAHQIRKQGGQVELVVLFDTWAKLPNRYLVTWHQWRQDWKQQPSLGFSTERLSLSIGSRLRRTWRITRWLLGQERNRIRSFFKRDVLNPDDFINMLDEQGMPLPGGLLDRLYRNFAKSYRPRPLDSRGILFTTDSTDTAKAVRAFDDTLGWKNLFVRGLEIVPMIGDHLSMIREHNSTLAREMNEVLKRHWSSPPDKVGDAHEPRRAAPGPETRAIASLDFPDG